jgi:hypothetical protein
LGEIQVAKARTPQKGKGTAPKKRRLSELRGILPATKPYIGVEATRQEVARQLGEELERKLRKR